MNEPRPRRVAIYARVSTDDKGQDPENQLRELRAWCENAGHAIVAEYVEHESGGKSPDYRKRLAAVFEDAGRRKFDLLLFWALDRFSREGLAATVMHLQRLDAAGVAFHSYTEPHLNAEDELVRAISLAMLATFAKLERKRISARTKAGLERVRAQGKRLGRPPLPEHKRRRIEELAGTKSVRAIARETGVSVGTVQAQLTAMRKASSD